MPSSLGTSAIMTIGEVAGYLKVCRADNVPGGWRQKVPCLKVGGSWRFSHLDVDASIKEETAG